MRLLLTLVVILVVLAGALVFYLVATTPRAPAEIRFPLTDAQRQLLASVPADSDTFALIPSAAAFEAKLRRNDMMREALDAWTEDRRLPSPWMLGPADLVIWRAPGGVAYGFQLDPVRAFLIRAYALFGGPEFRERGSTFVVGPPADGEAFGEARLEPILRMAEGMSGDAVVVQRGDEQAFPPIDRPAVSTITAGPSDIVIVSRAADASGAPAAARRVTLPRTALLSAWFGEPPRIAEDLDRLLPGRISGLLGGGGSIVLYDVELGRLLPRPKGLFVIPETPAAREAAARLAGVAELVGEISQQRDRILFSIDDTSLGAYSAEQFSDLSFPATEWALRMDAQRMLPLVERLGDHTGLRLAAPRLYRSVRDLRGWIRHFQNAGMIEAARSEGAEGQELRVRITAK